MPTYPYQSLNKDAREIRLVRTTRREPGAEPQFELVTVSLDKNPTYHAISYVWGDPSTDKYGVVIGNQWLDTTRSTFEILHHHLGWWSKYDSGRPEDVYYWIDFLCINQKNMTERNSQVLLMKDIYSKAKTVISYLKPDDLDETDVAKHFLASLETDLLSRHATGLAPSAGWEAISKLYSHPYWTRMWIVQEI
ncbi:heterokaryon incompatibility protein-domain-containing protein, partial [Lasiosphaeris hirsuta]